MEVLVLRIILDNFFLTPLNASPLPLGIMPRATSLYIMPNGRGLAL